MKPLSTMVALAATALSATAVAGQSTRPTAKANTETHASMQVRENPGDAAKSDPIVIVDSLDPADAPGPLTEEDFGGYVFAYFKDQDQSAYLAVSRDGYTWVDLNDGERLFNGEELAEQKGVRDPHIGRGPDGAFYLVMTDLHIFGDRAGYRETRWQRPEEPYGWGNNRALVLMKSYDLVHWTHSDFIVSDAFPELGDITTAWAPHSLYDEEAGKMMVYFTIRHLNGNAGIYASYANDDFTKLETLPVQIAEAGGIDADLIKVGDTRHQFIVQGGKIKHLTSDQLIGGYGEPSERIDPNDVDTEAPQVFKRIGTDTYVLMYDVYGARPNNMGFSETTDFETWTHIGRFNEGPMKGVNFERPKHGAISYLTADELDRVLEHFGAELPESGD